MQDVPEETAVVAADNISNIDETMRSSSHYRIVHPSNIYALSPSKGREIIFY